MPPLAQCLQWDQWAADKPTQQLFHTYFVCELPFQIICIWLSLQEEKLSLLSEYGFVWWRLEQGLWPRLDGCECWWWGLLLVSWWFFEKSLIWWFGEESWREPIAGGCIVGCLTPFWVLNAIIIQSGPGQEEQGVGKACVKTGKIFLCILIICMLDWRRLWLKSPILCQIMVNAEYMLTGLTRWFGPKACLLPTFTPVFSFKV